MPSAAYLLLLLLFDPELPPLPLLPPLLLEPLLEPDELFFEPLELPPAFCAMIHSPLQVRRTTGDAAQCS